MKNEIIFKWYNENDIPMELYELTDAMVGISEIDNSKIYSINFNCNITILKKLIVDDSIDDIFPSINKLLRNYKIHKIVNKINGKNYHSEDLEKFSIFLQYYYQEEGNINII